MRTICSSGDWPSSHLEGLAQTREPGDVNPGPALFSFVLFLLFRGWYLTGDVQGLFLALCLGSTVFRDHMWYPILKWGWLNSWQVASLPLPLSRHPLLSAAHATSIPVTPNRRPNHPYSTEKETEVGGRMCPRTCGYKMSQLG